MITSIDVGESNKHPFMIKKKKKQTGIDENFFNWTDIYEKQASIT